MRSRATAKAKGDEMKTAIFLILFAIYCQGQEIPVADPSFTATLALGVAVLDSFKQVIEAIKKWNNRE